MKLLIELPTWLGDCVMTTPAIENIISSYPNSKVIFIGSRVSVDLMKNHPNCLEVIYMNKSIIKLILIAYKIGFVDIFFSFRSSPRVKLFSMLVNASRKFHYQKNNFKNGHQVEKYNEFINESLGLKTLPKGLLIHKKYPKGVSNKLTLGINPGASYGSAKCWSYENFTKVALSLSYKFDILIFGGKDEINLSKKIEKRLIKSGCKNFVNLAGKTSIDDLVNKISSLSLFITGDSGPMHIASAFQVPTISLFGPTKAHETSQWMNNKSIILKKELPCQPCMKRVCPLGHHDCMKKITSEEVINSALSLI